MENEIKYRHAIELFEQENYEGAVELFIQLYDEDYEKEAILQILYDCFVTPNEAEFVSNYKKNCENLCENDYEELLLDFIPVSDTKYYIFHKKLGQFFGSIDISGDEEEEKEAEIHSVLIADIWDLRDMLPYIRMRGWNTCYILLEENRNEFLSFLKLPDIESKYLGNAIIFTDSEIMKAFFTECTDYYIPKEIVSGNAAKYREILYELHRRRLEDTRSERKNILLSVCIPSYGRGSVCLENVQNILQTEYDAEIEIVVSNNGSRTDTEGYETIKNLRDSRITYYEFKENQGYPSNVCKTLELAKGQFVAFASDEDFMKVENLHAYMNFLINHKDAGYVLTSGIGENFINESGKHLEKGSAAFSYAINSNYLTGIALNNFWVRRNNVLEKIAQNRDNKFVDIYMHAALTLLTAENTGADICDVVLWESVVELENPEEGEVEIVSYMFYESRIEQQNAAVEFIEKVMHLNTEEQIYLIMDRVWKTYFLCQLAYKKRTAAYRKLIDWRALCSRIHKNNLNLLANCSELLTEQGIENLRRFLEDTFVDFIGNNPMKPLMTQNELTDYKMVEEIAKYLRDQGRPVSELDYLELEREWRAFVEKI